MPSIRNKPEAITRRTTHAKKSTAIGYDRVKPHQCQILHCMYIHIIKKPEIYSWNHPWKNNSISRHIAMAIWTPTMYMSPAKSSLGGFRMNPPYCCIFVFNMNWVSEPELKSSGRNTSLTLQVSTFIPQPVLIAYSIRIWDRLWKLPIPFDWELRWVPTAHCAGRRGLNLLTAVRPVELAQCTRPKQNMYFA